MVVSVDLIKALRERTGAGVGDCKKALEASGGDIEKAMDWLVRKGLTKMRERGREALEGIIYGYVHPGSKIGVLAEINCNTDFVARTPEFQQFAEDVAMQIAAMNPLYISQEHVPEAEIRRQREIFREQIKDLNKPPHVIEKIIDGKLKKWYSEVCLLDQPFIKDDTKTIDTLRGELIAKTGENVQVRRFVRYALGEK